MDFTQYISPELLAMIPFLNLLGWFVKEKTKLNNKYIPLVLGIVSIVLSFAYTLSSQTISIAMVCTAIVQGVMLSATAVYANQMTKQMKKEE
jgi:Kef-type K+ transport system membrane component KefB